MDGESVKLSLQSVELPVVAVYLHIIYLLAILALLRFIFGKHLIYPFYLLYSWWKELKSKQEMPYWVAHCKEKKDIPQKQDIKPIDLKGQYIKSIKFTVSLVGNPDFWRAGFMVGNEKYFAHNVVDSDNAITIHTGSGYDKKNKILPIWKYYGDFKQNNPDSSSVSTEDIKNIDFAVDINENNFMIVKIENEVVFAQRIDASFRRRFFLKAWADDKPDYKVKFSEIKYSLWN